MVEVGRSPLLYCTLNQSPLLFLTFSVCQPEKTTLQGGQPRSWSAEQGNLYNSSAYAMPVAYSFINVRMPVAPVAQRYLVSLGSLFAVHGLSERTTVQTSSLLLGLIFCLRLGQPDPTRPISLTQTPTPAGVRLVIVPCGLILCASLVRFCICCVPNLRSKDPWQWAGFSCSQYR